MYKVYKLTLPDGRAYIGMTGQENLNRRWANGLGYDKNITFYHEIVHYGWKNVKKEVIETLATKAEAMERELYYIGLYKTYLPEYGFNIHGKSHFAEPKEKYQYIITELGLSFDTLQEVGDYLGLSKERIRQVVKSGKACCKKKYHIIKVKI